MGPPRRPAPRPEPGLDSAPPTTGPASEAGPRVYGVGELLAGLKGLLADRVGRLWVAGEICDLHRARSGHVYFTLRDDDARLRAALFRTAARRVPFEPDEGMAVLVYGDVTVYEPRGDLQISVRALEPRGRGALQVAFEKLRRRLEAEGLFDPARKRPLPALPRRLGVVTSPTGAALRDVLHGTGRRLPSVPVRIAPTRVQGPGAAEEIAAALLDLAHHGDVDLVLLVRGGGSLEDLQPFNTETLARALAACPVPVVSGVGHEVDVTIADLAADARAPTPSAAAELAVPDRAAIALRLARDGRRLAHAARGLLRHRRAELRRAQGALKALAPTARLATWRARLAAAARALPRTARVRLDAERAELGALSGRLDSLSPLAVLGRGYALVRRTRDGAVVRRAEQVARGEALSVRVAEASIEARAESVRTRPPVGKTL